MQGKTAWKWGRKNRLKIKEKRAIQNDKIQKTFVIVFAEYEFDWTTWQNLKKAAAEKIQKTEKKSNKTKKSKLILSRKYFNCHQNKNSLTYHRRNTKNIFHSFSKQKHSRSKKRLDCSIFLPKILCYMQQNSWKLLFVSFLAFLKPF